ncbi:MAG: hypothetical protein EAZ87_00525 [Nostocales cyanobacterium]|nr:MAG: hypothetical protein EAZ87_00525 [Nostocales cyanobacterium]
MNLKKSESQSGVILKTIYKFIGGATLGGFVVSIPILYYGASTNLSLLQICFVLTVIITSGLLSSIWGEKFINAVMDILNASSL